MAWYWIALIIIGYIVFIIITGVLVYYRDWAYKDTAVFPSIFWPLVLPLLIIDIIISKLIDKIDND